MSTGSSKQERQSEVGAELELLEREVSRYLDLILRGGDKLSSVLRQELPVGPSETGEVPGLVPLAEDIRRQKNRLTDGNGSLESLFTRLELP